MDQVVKVRNDANYDPQNLPLSFSTAGAAAVDLRLAECVRLKPGEIKAAKTGVYLEIPEGFAGLILPRSGLGSKGLVLANTVGLIDSDYRGEIVLMLMNRNTTGKPIHVEEGDRAAQMVFIPVGRPIFQMVKAISSSDRGEGGFGSTGVK